MNRHSWAVDSRLLGGNNPPGLPAAATYRHTSHDQGIATHGVHPRIHRVLSAHREASERVNPAIWLLDVSDPVPDYLLRDRPGRHAVSARRLAAVRGRCAGSGR